MTIHKEGRKIVLITAIICLVLVGSCWRLLGCTYVGLIGIFLVVAFFFFITRFFRVPKRIPVIDDNAVIAPADGTIVLIEEVFESEYLKTRCMQVSIFMSIYNVHINWFPVKGLVEYYCYHRGKYLVAWHPKSSEKNEHTSIVVNTGKVKILFRQIAGFIARRIVCYAAEGKQVVQGSQTGFIKFGSRVDLFLPLDVEIAVKMDQKVVGTQTVIARLSED